MKTISLVALSFTGLLLAIQTPALQAKDDVRVVLTSKVDAAKGHMRDKAASDWLTEEDLKKLNETKRDQKQQLIYFEHHNGTDKWRAIYTDKVMLRGFSWWIFYGQNEMEAKVNVEMGKGLKPAFIVRNGTAYAMLFVAPEQLADARKALDELGIGEPKLKK